MSSLAADPAFWLAAAALVILALAFIVWPLATVQAPRRQAANRRGLMRALYRDRVAEIEAEAEAGQLDPETRHQVVDELGANLLAEYQAASETPGRAPQAASAGPRLAFWVLLVLVPVAGIGVYLSSGEPDAMSLAGASELLRLDPDSERDEIERWQARLAQRVERHPEDGQSWYLLGVSRLQLGEFSAASDAFGQAHRHVGSDPNLELYWLQSRYLAAGGQMDEQSRSLAQRILRVRPNHPLVLEMFAIDAYRRGEFRTAVEHLNRALGNPLQAAQRTALLSGLEQARSRMGTLTPSIDVDIEAPAGAPRGGTLFVIARPPGGGMPYAVVRRPGSQLPMSVRLDDTVSMSGINLSDAEAIEVVVRLSRSGNPTAAPGDWEWRSEVLQLADLSAPLSLEASLQPRAGGES